MKLSTFNHLMLVLVAGMLAGCGHLRRPPKAQPVMKVAPLFVGTVKLVNEEEHFVLIDSGASPSPAPGSVLTTEAPDGHQPAELKAGEIRRRPFAIADVVKGTPRVGERVYQQPR
jgi:hypothetical protein